ncbi:MAG: ATP-dependent DNA helicase RecG [Candidatus Bipolaricaulota bacterium]
MRTTEERSLEERLALVRKVLALERRKGHADTAATGGLERFLEQHLPEGAHAAHGYGKRSSEERQGIIEDLEALLERLEAGEAAGDVATLAEPVERAVGVGTRRGKQLRRLGIETVEDLLLFFPRRLEDRSRQVSIAQLADGVTATVEGVVQAKSRIRVRRGLELVKVAVADAGGILFVIWFNQPWMWEELKQGQRYAFFGKAQVRYGELQMENPVWEQAGTGFHTGRWVPIYPATEGLSQVVLRGLIRRNLGPLGHALGEVVPEHVRRRLRLVPRRQAVERIHFPEGPQDFQAARRALAFEELFLLQVGLAMREEAPGGPARKLEVDQASVKAFAEALPFSLTGAQLRALDEVQHDLQSDRPMWRLLQGDVGSGKTAVAAGAAVAVHSAGAQTAVMAPTEILAQQHSLVLGALLGKVGLRVELLVGGMPVKERKRVLEELAAGEVPVVVGTHALLQEDVSFGELGLAVVDEQHRFGVVQRAQLESKGRGANVLVMSATPIPRTVVLTVYGRFAISVLDEMPRERSEVKTMWVSESRRQEVYGKVGKLLQSEGRGYVVFPLVEESEEVDLRDATRAHEELSRRFSDAGAALVHGRMSAEEKRAAMEAFRSGEARLLVATSVVEVGLDVPDASFLVIEHADRFGLAQLHQLRGRIGRAGQSAVCFAIADPATEDGQRRLTAFRDLSDGFDIAEEDLRIRGPGDVLGTAQHGFASRLRMADLVRDLPLLEQARKEAEELAEQGLPPELTAEVERRFGDTLELLGV